MLGQTKFVRDATLAYATPWCMTMSHSNTRYGGEKPADPIRFWTKNAAGVFKQISLPPESLEGSILRLVVSKFILYRRQGKNGVMLELGKNVMVLKNGAKKEPKYSELLLNTILVVLTVARSLKTIMIVLV